MTQIEEERLYCLLSACKSWVEGIRLSDGERGWFPKTYVEEITSRSARLRNLRENIRINGNKLRLVLSARHRAAAVDVALAGRRRGLLGLLPAPLQLRHERRSAASHGGVAASVRLQIKGNKLTLVVNRQQKNVLREENHQSLLESLKEPSQLCSAGADEDLGVQHRTWRKEGTTYTASLNSEYTTTDLCSSGVQTPEDGTTGGRSSMTASLHENPLDLFLLRHADSPSQGRDQQPTRSLKDRQGRNKMNYTVVGGGKGGGDILFPGSVFTPSHWR
ncbi:Rho guanine nucleotide exchange factor 19 [Liparis tanakae]|uniref:Rho guanine nucleotide exchange factor 19 n=1 Tax=Liparis tanakae TaxID=230148 RepID=A0A4Z2F968_9TELE|nr:Rho guanine nucleotide exchange factor 19 [Liparis tanakae]